MTAVGSTSSTAGSEPSPVPVVRCEHSRFASADAFPPFYIYNSSAKSDNNFCVKVDWLVGLPTVTGRYGCPTRVDSDSFYAVRPRGSMDDTLLNQYIESVIVPLYPNMHKTAVFDERTGKLNQGPVILKVDAGPGRIVLS